MAKNQRQTRPIQGSLNRIHAMGKTILTSQQSHFLELVSQEHQITKNFYLTGGTALAEFYYQHRYSEDIDLFTEQAEVDPKLPEALLKRFAPKLGIANWQRSQMLGLFSFLLMYNNGSKLKVDFNYYPFPRIEKGLEFKGLQVDSIHDMAANKLHTIFMKPRARDYVDLYFILKHEDFELKKLIIDAKTKFDWHIDKTTLASQLLRAKEFPEEYQMLVPFSKKDMGNFYVDLAQSLKKDIFR